MLNSSEYGNPYFAVTRLTNRTKCFFHLKLVYFCVCCVFMCMLYLYRQKGILIVVMLYLIILKMDEQALNWTNMRYYVILSLNSLKHGRINFSNNVEECCQVDSPWFDKNSGPFRFCGPDWDDHGTTKN